MAYFCAVLPDELDGSTPEEAVRATAREHLEQRAAAFWPGAFTDGRFDWDVLFDPVGRTGPDRLQAQYFRANVAATDRYVTTAAGTVDSRLDPEQSGFQNLALAGDWTHSGIDGGCVEAAVISGERAARGLIARHGGADPSPGPGPAMSTTARWPRRRGRCCASAPGCTASSLRPTVPASRSSATGCSSSPPAVRCATASRGWRP